MRALRSRLGIHPVYKTVDTCAAEFEAKTPYHYSSYELDPAAETEVAPQTEKPKVLILGSGPTGSARASSSTTAVCTPRPR